MATNEEIEVQDEREPRTDDGASGDVSATASAAPRAMFHLGRIDPPPPLQVKGNLSQNWRDWQQVWKSYEIVTGLREGDDDMRVATFITCIGQRGLRIYNALPFRSEAEKMNMERVLDLFHNHCVGESNVIYDRYVFNTRDQEEQELFDNHLTVLRELANRCHYQSMADELLRDRIVCGIRDSGLRKRLLGKKGLTLPGCIDMCKACEVTARQAKAMESEVDTVHAVGRTAQREPVRKYPQGESERKNTGSGSKVRRPAAGESGCSHCGLVHAKGREQHCPAYGRKCRK